MKKYSLTTLIGFYLLAGFNHFIIPDFYIPLIPDYLPMPKAINYLSGAAEIFLALLLVYPKSRRSGVYGIVLLLFLFIPSHIYFISEGNCFEGYFCVSAFISWFRLIIIHPILMLWAWSHRNNFISFFN